MSPKRSASFDHEEGVELLDGDSVGGHAWISWRAALYGPLASGVQYTDR